MESVEPQTDILELHLGYMEIQHMRRRAQCERRTVEDMIANALYGESPPSDGVPEDSDERIRQLEERCEVMRSELEEVIRAVTMSTGMSVCARSRGACTDAQAVPPAHLNW